jgi:2-amino-4-hydroxy-6-hydroxymethyldihydropteridine diphosphokinase
MSSTFAIALGSNLGDRAYTMRCAIDELRKIVHIVRVSSFLETEPVDAPPGSPRFLNAVVLGHTSLAPMQLLEAMQTIESRLGRRRTGVRNAPRTIDLDLIFHSAHRARSPRLTLPHPRYHEREFVMKPLKDVTFFLFPCLFAEVPASPRLNFDARSSGHALCPPSRNSK